MDSEKTSGHDAGKKESRLVPTDQRDVARASEFASSFIKEMEQLEDNVDGMNFIQSFWDSKIPEDDKGFIKRVSFKFSDTDKLKEDIRKYKDFYEALFDAMEKLRGNKEKSATEADDLCTIILHVNELLGDMDKIAQSGIRTSDSKIICELHQQFVAKHTEVDNMVRRVECVVSRERIKSLTSLLDDCQKTILSFQNGMQDFQRLKDGLQEQIIELVKQNQNQRHREQALLATNEKLREDQERLLRQHNDTCSRMENIEKLLKQLVLKDT